LVLGGAVARGFHAPSPEAARGSHALSPLHFFTCSFGFFFVIRDLGVSCGFFLYSGCVGIGFLLGLGVFFCILEDFIVFFFISKKNFYKKRKAPLGTQEVYTGTTKANPKKPTTPMPQNTKEPNKIQKNPTKNNKTHYPSRHNRPTTYVPCLSYA
jgi:hypothetical protein